MERWTELPDGAVGPMLFYGIVSKDYFDTAVSHALIWLSTGMEARDGLLSRREGALPFCIVEARDTTSRSN